LKNHIKNGDSSQLIDESPFFLVFRSLFVPAPVSSYVKGNISNINIPLIKMHLIFMRFIPFNNDSLQVKSKSLEILL
ncbi:hypothetical protein, partial [Lacicoccus qingdaonensis]|uniref:hypothetical protein n=1 Tax=Lacicoccus qingdaonensis TaxID=576118 RepID=UPI001C40B1C3